MSIDEMNRPVQMFRVGPGAVSTDLNNHMTGEGVWTLEEAAEWIVGLALNEKNHNGQIIHYDGCVGRLLRFSAAFTFTKLIGILYFCLCSEHGLLEFLLGYD